MTFHNCTYCTNSYRSDDKRKDHETICVKNGKTDAERFQARQELKIETKEGKVRLREQSPPFYNIS